MHHSLKRLGIVLLASFALMSFRLEPEVSDSDKLLFDVRGAFVAARPWLRLASAGLRLDRRVRAVLGLRTKG